MSMSAGFLEEPKLLSFAYAVEQSLQPRRQPTYAGTLQPLPANPGICAGLPKHAAASGSPGTVVAARWVLRRVTPRAPVAEP